MHEEPNHENETKRHQSCQVGGSPHNILVRWQAFGGKEDALQIPLLHQLFNVAQQLLPKVVFLGQLEQPELHPQGQSQPDGQRRRGRLVQQALQAALLLLIVVTA